MSDQKTDPTNNGETTTPGEDLAMDALLREHAHRKGASGADTEFLSNLETALDAVDEAGPDEQGEDAPSRIPAPILWSTALAACLTLMLFVNRDFRTTSFDRNEAADKVASAPTAAAGETTENQEVASTLETGSTDHPGSGLEVAEGEEQPTIAGGLSQASAPAEEAVADKRMLAKTKSDPFGSDVEKSIRNTQSVGGTLKDLKGRQAPKGSTPTLAIEATPQPAFDPAPGSPARGPETDEAILADGVVSVAPMTEAVPSPTDSLALEGSRNKSPAPSKPKPTSAPAPAADPEGAAGGYRGTANLAGKDDSKTDFDETRRESGQPEPGYLAPEKQGETYGFAGTVLSGGAVAGGGGAAGRNLAESPAELAGGVPLPNRARELRKAADGLVNGGIEGEARDANVRFSNKEAAKRLRQVEDLSEIADEEMEGLGRGIRLRRSQGTAGESYAKLTDNPFKPSLEHPLSTFSIDVDTASYANLRRMITDGQRVPADAVRIEEMINYFSYNYPEPEGEHPFAVDLEVGPAAWQEGHRLVRVGLKGIEIDEEKRPSANLVFLLDVSGSMNSHDKLPLVKRAMTTLVENIAGDDTVGIVVYAGREGIALPPTDGGRKKKILEAIQALSPGGSTNGEGGIKLAYKLAQQHFLKEGINRVVLCTDGDFNVGTSGTEELAELVKKKAKSGVFLSVCGFGTGNLNDAMLEKITNDGNGNYYYIDSANEAEKVFCDDLAGTLVTIAKDVKIQVEFNPAKVESYRLIGYANRMLRNRDFEDDRIDAGEIGAGHNVTALYEIVPIGARPNVPEGTELKYQKPGDRLQPKKVAEGLVKSPELLTVKLRYKQPDGDKSILIEKPLVDKGSSLDDTSDDFRFASAAAGFGMLLRDSEYKGELDRDTVLSLGRSAKGKDPEGHRKEFLQLVKDAKL